MATSGATRAGRGSSGRSAGSGGAGAGPPSTGVQPPSHRNRAVKLRVKRRENRTSLLAAFALAQFATCGNAIAAEAVVSGLRIGFAVTAVTSDGMPPAGRDAGFAFTLATEPNGAPVRGARPAAWLVPRTSGSGLDARQCRQAAAAFVRGGTLTVPAVDLNTFHVLALGGDATISVIDPRIGFGGSRLIGLATL